jgi:hypothetical protein
MKWEFSHINQYVSRFKYENNARQDEKLTYL